MKATGIVRRIDDLGRVVIPKEIRRTQFIRVGDPLEIYVSGNNEVIFKKHSLMGELSELAQAYVEVLYKSSGVCAVIADRDRIIAAPTVVRDSIERRLSKEYEKCTDERKTIVLHENPINVCEFSEIKACIVSPIITAGDMIGSIAMVHGANASPNAPFPVEHSAAAALLHVAANVLAKQMEE